MRSKKLAVTATLFGGVLAGASLDRAFVGMPTLWKLGPKADLSIRGAAFDPTLAFGNTILSIATAVPNPRNRPATIAAGLASAGLLLTLKAAPNMLRLREIDDDDEAAIEEAMGGE